MSSPSESKLKTLKDLEIKSIDDVPYEGLIDIEDLRQEAIKWIKKLNELFTAKKEWHEINIKEYFPYALNEKEHLALGANRTEILGRIMEIKTWIKYFFNITEEDLK